LRHTWGFQEYGFAKAMTIDELMHGRKRRDGTRMDEGTGLSKQSVIDGLKRAIARGYLLCTIDETDRARIKKSYALKMYKPDVQAVDSSGQDAGPPEIYADVQAVDSGGQDAGPRMSGKWTPDVQEADSNGQDVGQRSEKDTEENHQKKTTKENHQRKPPVATAQADAGTGSLPQKDELAEKASPPRRRKPAKSTIRNEACEAFFDLFDTLLQEVTGDQTNRYERSKDAAEHIIALLQENGPHPEFVTPAKVRAVYLRLWQQPKDPRTGFYWREHLSIKAICKNYGTQIIALGAQGQERSAQDDPYTFKALFAS
jgi:hypothetical protein